MRLSQKTTATTTKKLYRRENSQLRKRGLQIMFCFLARKTGKMAILFLKGENTGRGTGLEDGGDSATFDLNLLNLMCH